MNITIDPLHVPASIDAPDAGEWHAYVALVNAMQREDSGSDLFDGDAAAWLSAYRHQEYRRTHLVAARDNDGTVVGIGNCTYETEGGSSALGLIAVRREHRGVGIEDALHREVEAIAREAGQRYLESFGFVPGDSDARNVLRPTSGDGSVPRDDDWTRFFLRHGYELVQVERASTFDLQEDLAPVRAALDDAFAVAGPDYEALWWLTPTPPEHLAGYAAAISRLVTDAPSGDREVDEIAWDAERVRARDRMKAEAGLTLAVTAVRYRPTGDLVAYNEIQVLSDRTRPSENIGTLVVAGHRGRRLGTVVKALGLLNWHEAVPTSPAVQTFNAEENYRMIGVNERVGFVAVCWTGEWQKALA